MLIRPATPRDVPAVLPMVAAVAALHAQWDADRFAPLAKVEQMYRGWLIDRATDPRSVFFVADRELPTDARPTANPRPPGTEHDAATDATALKGDPDQPRRDANGDTEQPRLAASDDARSDTGTGALAGFIVGQIEANIPIYVLRSYGWVHDLWVEPAYRNEGVARQLVMAAIERFTQLGVRQVRLETASANDPARGLFAACGFRASSVEMLLPLRPTP